MRLVSVAEIGCLNFSLAQPVVLGFGMGERFLRGAVEDPVIDFVEVDADLAHPELAVEKP